MSIHMAIRVELYERYLRLWEGMFYSLQCSILGMSNLRYWIVGHYHRHGYNYYIMIKPFTT